MYEEYWKLEVKPFEPAADARFLFASQDRTAALHKLRYAIENRRPAALLTGPAGCGKTLLWHAVAGQMEESIGIAAEFLFPLMSPREMLAYLADQISARPAEEALKAGPPSIEASLARLEHAFIENSRHGKLAVLMVDEAHMLEDAGLLEPLRLLMNLRQGDQPLFTLMLLGQLAAVPMMNRCNYLDDRLEMQVLLKPFRAEETAGYIEHRLVAAGASRPLFTPEALEVAHQLTGGIARRINRLCDLALLVGYAAQSSQIDAPQLHSVHAELVTVSAAAA